MEGDSVKELEVLSKLTPVIHVYAEYTQRCDDLQKAEARLKREESEAEKRKRQAEAGEFIFAEGSSTLANFNNGYVTYIDVLQSQYDENQLAQNNSKDPLTRIREEVKLQKDRVTEASNCLRMLLGYPEGRLEFPSKELSQQ